MTTKKIPISFNEEDIKTIEELIKLMGISGVYGDFPKAVKFSINLALSTVKNPEKVYNTLNDENLDLFFKTAFNYAIKERNLKKAMKYQNLADKV